MPGCGCVEHGLEYFSFYVQKHTAYLVFWTPAGLRQAARGAHISEPRLLSGTDRRSICALYEWTSPTRMDRVPHKLIQKVMDSSTYQREFKTPYWGNTTSFTNAFMPKITSQVEVGIPMGRMISPLHFIMEIIVRGAVKTSAGNKHQRESILSLIEASMSCLMQSSVKISSLLQSLANLHVFKWVRMKFKAAKTETCYSPKGDCRQRASPLTVNTSRPFKSSQ